MSSTILYKFRASSTFEALPLPGSAARLFDVKKAIVKANKLDAGSMEFDLAVRNADTSEEYANESMLLPRGTRLIVQRLPAARGQGFLARMARNEHAGVSGAGQQHPSGYYTIDSRARDDDEFVTTSSGTNTESNEDRELAALQAVTAVQTSGPAMTGAALGGRRGPPQPAGMGPPVGQRPNFHKPIGAPARPNADPELRDQEQQPKKRMTGIPRTFLSLSAPPQTEGGEGEQQTSMLQPNKIGFEELINRGGGQSENSVRAKSLEYALSITSTTVPEHLQCAICHNVVKNAMLLPWDPEGRTVCESCIRDALTQNGFRCPLTGIDGVSPDDLIPNVGLRKAADMFVKGVMEKLQEIQDQQVEDITDTADDTNAQTSENNILDGEGVEKGVIVSKRMSLTSHKKSGDDDPFGGGDLFGGDVFAVAKPQTTEEDVEIPKNKADDSKEPPKTASDAVNPSSNAEPGPGKEEVTIQVTDGASDSKVTNVPGEGTNGNASVPPGSSNQTSSNDNATGGEAVAADSVNKPPESPASSVPSHRREYRRRGPPAGYTMGPAGGAVGSAYATPNPPPPPNGNLDHGGFDRGGGRGRFPPRGGGGGRYHDDRGGRGFGRGRGGRGRFDDNRSYQNDDDDSSRGTKRSYDDQMDHMPPDGRGGRFRHEGRGGRGGGRGGYRGGGRGGGAGGRWDGPPRGGRGGYRGRGRGRY